MWCTVNVALVDGRICKMFICSRVFLCIYWFEPPAETSLVLLLIFYGGSGSRIIVIVVNDDLYSAGITMIPFQLFYT